MFDGVDGPITRGRIVGLGAGKKFLAIISTPERGSSLLAVSHGLVTVKRTVHRISFVVSWINTFFFSNTTTAASSSLQPSIGCG
jgi:hypothetical protein